MSRHESNVSDLGDVRAPTGPPCASVSVVCPMYNEEALIEDNVTRLVHVLGRLDRPWELLLVNDGSTDGTLAKVVALAETYHRVRIISYRRNRGRGYALRQGFLQAKGDIVVATESDLSYGEEIVQRLVDELEANELDAVVASPHCHGGGLSNVPFARRFYTQVGNRILQLLMPVKLSTYTGMTRAYRREAIQCLDLQSDGKEIHLEIISKLGSLGYQVGEIPAALTWPKGRKTRKSSFRAWPYIVSHLFFGISEAPLFLLGVAGLSLIILGVVLGIYLLALSITGTPVGGRPMVSFSALAIVVGFFTLLFGALAQQNKQLERQLHRVQREIRRGNGDVVEDRHF